MAEIIVSRFKTTKPIRVQIDMQVFDLTLAEASELTRKVRNAMIESEKDTLQTKDNT